MAGRREVGFSKTSSCSLREQLARTTLLNVRSQGHTYVELREDGKRVIFFCTLCLSPCYSGSVLFDHLKGNLHTERYTAAKSTLLKSNPWPFNDGVYFFHDSTEQAKQLPALNANRASLLDTHRDDEYNFAIIAHVEDMGPISNAPYSPYGFDSSGVDSDCDKNSYDRNLNGKGNEYNLTIPGVLQKEEICELHVRFIGAGQIAARFCGKDGASKGISRMWCEWLGKKDFGKDTHMIAEHDFAVVTFAYNYDLGRKGLFDDVRYFLLSSSQQDMEGARKKRRRKSFSDPEDITEFLSNQYDSSREETLSSNSSSSKFAIGWI